MWCPEGEELKYFEISIKGSPQEGACCDLAPKESFTFAKIPFKHNLALFDVGNSNYLPLTYRAAPASLLAGPKRPPFMLKAGKVDPGTPIAAAECCFKDPGVKVDPIQEYM